MVEEIIIGRNGNQPFQITAEGVSGHHASLTKRHDGVLVLKDLDSKNGTFVRNQQFLFERIEEKVVDKDSVIRLGDETINGITFSVSRLFTQDVNDYTYEFGRIKRKWKSYVQEKKDFNRRWSMYMYIPSVLSAVCLIMSFLPIFKQFANETQMFIMRVPMVVSMLVTPIIHNMRRSREKVLSEKSANLFICPRPGCGRLLSESEIRKTQCMACKAHG